MNYTSPLFYCEVIAAISNIIYSLLLMKEKITGWAFGILASVLSVIVFYESKLYAQSIISIYYATIGVYGWIYWQKANKRNEHISRWSLHQHLIYISLFSFISLLSYFLFSKYTDASRPMLDSFLTIFGFLASIKEARKILSSWIYWFVINIFSAFLYYSQDLTIYALLMVLYTFICIPGYLSWKKIYLKNLSQ